MKLRKALKVCNGVYGYRIKQPRWRSQTIAAATAKCRRIERRMYHRSISTSERRRMPYIPNEDEIEERALWGLSFLADALLPEDVADEVKQQIWATV